MTDSDTDKNKDEERREKKGVLTTDRAKQLEKTVDAEDEDTDEEDEETDE